MNFEVNFPKKKQSAVHFELQKDEDFNFYKKLTLEHSTTFIIAPTLQAYKRSLMIKLIFGFILFLCFILERIFHPVIQIHEIDLILSLQDLWFGNMDILSDKTTFLYYYLGKIGEFHIFFLLMTHLFVTLYVGIDAIIALKIMNVTFISTFIMTLLSFVNGESRPYWANTQIKAFYCERTYSDPGLVTFLGCFLIFYSYRCFNQKEEELLATTPFETSFSDDEGLMFNEEQRQWLSRGILVLGLLIYGLMLFMRFLMGIEYLINYFLSFIIFASIYSLVISMDSFIDDLIKQSTILKMYAKSKVFNWLIFLLILEGLASVIYFQTDYKTDLVFIQNYYRCQNHSNQTFDTQKLYNDVLGKAETFQATSILFALIGLIFGASQTFRVISSINWYKGPMKIRIYRIFIANLALVPSWIFTTFQEDLMNLSGIHLLGLSNFMLDSVHYCMLYYGLFGVIPVYIYLYYGLEFVDLKFSIVLTH